MTNPLVKGTQFRKLSDGKLDRIHAASLEILESLGVRLFEPQALELLKSKRRDNRRWKQGAPPGQTGGMGAFDRTQKRHAVITARRASDGAGRAQYVLRHRVGLPERDRPAQRRTQPGVLQDVVDATVVCDALPNIDFLMSFCIANDLNPQTYDRNQMRAMLMNTIKPILFVTLEYPGVWTTSRWPRPSPAGPKRCGKSRWWRAISNVSHACGITKMPCRAHFHGGEGFARPPIRQLSCAGHPGR